MTEHLLEIVEVLRVVDFVPFDTISLTGLRWVEAALGTGAEGDRRGQKRAEEGAAAGGGETTCAVEREAIDLFLAALLFPLLRWMGPAAHEMWSGKGEGGEEALS